MTLSKIEAYALPDRSELPRSRATWRPDPARAALLIHDMQDYFVGFYDQETQPIAAIVKNIRALRSACTARAIPLIYTAQPPEQSDSQRGLLNDLWGRGLTERPEAHEIIEALRPEHGDIVLTKYRYSAFHRTGLLELLRAQGRDQLFICGVYAHIGCLLTACDAFMNDVKPFFVTDGVADFSRDYHQLAIDYAAQRCAVTLTTADLLAALEGAHSTAVPAVAASLSRSAVRGEIARTLELESATLALEQDLFDLGLDSIRLMSLVESFRAQGAAVSFGDLAECRTLADVCALLTAPGKVGAAEVRA